MIIIKLMRGAVFFTIVALCSVCCGMSHGKNTYTVKIPCCSQRNALLQRKQVLSIPYALNQNTIAELETHLHIIEQKIKFHNDSVGQTQLKTYHAQKEALINNLKKMRLEQSKIKEELREISEQL